MFNPQDKRSVSKLRSAMVESLKRMDSASKNRLEAYRQYVGKHYTDDGSKDRVPLNMIEQAISIILRSLAASEPQALVLPPDHHALADAVSGELALNQHLRQTHFGRAMKTWVFEAMMSPMGIMKVALDATDSMDVGETRGWVGRPIAEPVFWDDWVQDMSVREVGKFGFCGNRYSIPKEEALEDGVLDPDLVEQIKTTREREKNSTKELTGADKPWSDDYREMIELWDVWLPDEGLLLTLSRDLEQLPPLRVVEWNGPVDGPYHYLWFNEVPGTTIPLPPVALWRDIHELANKLFNKLAKQALRQKTILPVPNDVLKDGQRTIGSSDGEGFPVEPGMVDKLKEMNLGGINNSNFAFVLQLKQLHSYYAGNIDALGGLGPQSGTLGQDQLLTGTASQRIKSMQDDVYVMTKGPLRAIWNYLTSNPAESIPIAKPIAGTRETVHSIWSPDVLTRHPDDYSIDIQPFSLQHLSPQERMQVLTAHVNGLLLPLAPFSQQQGQMINVEWINKLAAKYNNMPELAQCLLYLEGESQPDAEAGMPTNTTRTNIRESRPGRTDRGQEQVLINSLLGGVNQPSEQGRMTG